MTAKNENQFYREPSKEEIALSAFLAWERDGRPNGQDVKYWLEAEARLCEQRRKQAEIAAAQAAKPWPPGSKATTAPKAAPKTKPTPKLTTTVERGTNIKVNGAKTTKSAPATRRTALKSSR